MSPNGNAPRGPDGGDWDNASDGADTEHTVREATLLESPPLTLSTSTAPMTISSQTGSTWGTIPDRETPALQNPAPHYNPLQPDPKAAADTQPQTPILALQNIPGIATPKGSENEPTTHERTTRQTCPNLPTATDETGTPMDTTPITSPSSSDSNTLPGPGGNWVNTSDGDDTRHTDRETTLLEFSPPVSSIVITPVVASSLPTERVMEPNDHDVHAADVEMGAVFPGIGDRGAAPATGRPPEAAKRQ